MRNGRCTLATDPHRPDLRGGSGLMALPLQAARGCINATIRPLAAEAYPEKRGRWRAVRDVVDTAGRRLAFKPDGRS